MNLNELKLLLSQFLLVYYLHLLNLLFVEVGQINFNMILIWRLVLFLILILVIVLSLLLCLSLSLIVRLYYFLDFEH